MFASFFKSKPNYKYEDTAGGQYDQNIERDGCIIIYLINNLNKPYYYFSTERAFFKLLQTHTYERITQNPHIKVVNARNLTKRQMEIFVSKKLTQRLRMDGLLQEIEDVNGNLKKFEDLPWRLINLEENANRSLSVRQKADRAIRRIITRTDRTTFKMVGSGKPYRTKMDRKSVSRQEQKKCLVNSNNCKD